MKKISGISIIAVALMFCVSLITAKDSSKPLPGVKVKDLKGKMVNTASFSNDGKPIVINFWATWCKPCIQELNNISDSYEKWQKELGVKIIAVSIDDSRNSKRVAPFVSGRGWAYEVYLDENSDFKRALNITNPPHTLLVDGNGKIVWEHNGYAPGDEKELYQQIKNLVNK